MNIRNAIAKVFSANFLQLISGIIIGFIVPAILPIDGYANLKTYTLLISYVGLLHFGYLDGLHLKYGGKSFNEINKTTLKGEHTFIALVEFIITAIVIIIGFLTKDIVIMLFGMTILPANMSTFFKGIFQATGEFNNYTKILNIYTFLYTIINVFLAIVIKSENYIYYCLAVFFSHIVALIAFEIMFQKKYHKESLEFPKDIFNVSKSGALILLGNLSVVALFGIDKWFVKIFLTTEDFAYYSFAVSMLNVINTLVNAISITFYNYLFSNNNEKSINKLKKYLITLGGFASLGYFALSFIVTNFISKYIESLSIIAITFAVFPYMILINALYVNLYKVNKDEKKYFKIVISMLGISIIYNIIALIVFGTTTSIAFATVLTLITWVIYSTNDLEKVEKDKKMYIYILLLTVSFLLISHYFNWLLGIIAYFIIYILLTYIFNKEVLIDLKETTIKLINKLKEKYNETRK